MQAFELNGFSQDLLNFVRFALDVFVLIYYGLFDSDHLVLVSFVHFYFLICRGVSDLVVNFEDLFVLVLKLEHLFSEMSVVKGILGKFR